MDIGEPQRIVDVPEPARAPDHVPDEQPAPAPAREPEPVEPERV